MNSRPYISDSSNVQNENVYHTVPTTVPTQFGQQNVIVTHGQHKNLVDRTTTAIEDAHAYQYAAMVNPPCCQCQQPNQGIQGNIFGQKQLIPGGCTFTFQPMAQQYALRNFTMPNNQGMNNVFGQPLTLQQQIALNQLHKQALESMLLHEQFRENPFKLQFHKDGQTDTGDMKWPYPGPTTGNNVPPPQEQLLANNSAVANPTFPPSPLKQLNLKPDPSRYEDVGIQFEPEIRTVETQFTSSATCKCPDRNKQSETTDNQTATKKVTFDDPNLKGSKGRRGRKRAAQRNRRPVDEDSTDSSASSQSSEENPC